MDDSEVNPMKTGLMFVPLGLVMSPGEPTASLVPHRPTDLEAIEALIVQEAAAASQATRRPAYRHLLEYLWRGLLRRAPST